MWVDIAFDYNQQVSPGPNGMQPQWRSARQCCPSDGRDIDVVFGGRRVDTPRGDGGIGHVDS